MLRQAIEHTPMISLNSDHMRIRQQHFQPVHAVKTTDAAVDIKGGGYHDTNHDAASYF
jgi:hypothetical protein